jgi:hypothetical protein
MKKIFMASLALTVFAAAIVLFQMASCTKSDAQTSCPPATYPVTGLWEGTYQTNQVSHPATYVSLAIYPDGTIIRRSKIASSSGYAYFKGTWKLTGYTFEFKDSTLSYSAGLQIDTGTLTFSNDGTMSNGTWQDVGGTVQSFTGTFQNIKRIN